MVVDKESPSQQVVRYFFKLFFRLLYNEFAWTYNWVAGIVSLGRWKSWVLCVLPYLDDSDILELGIGPGHLQVALAEKGISAYGLDASVQMTRMASKNLSKNLFNPKISLGIAQDLPFPGNRFDNIVATFPSEYISDPQSLAQAFRVLKDDGELLIIPVAWITGKKWWDRLAAGLFQITGQAPGIDLESKNFEKLIPVELFQENGFDISLELIQLSTSKVLLLRAAKSNSGD
jgi:ubiquinone/menaquinone biosynthesis C-methylase UbiE